MKIVIVTSDAGLRKKIMDYFVPRNYEIIHYTNPIKAVDNYFEIDPDVVIFNVQDFPRHWKIGIQFLRDLKGRNDAVFILLSENPLTTEEADKALYLGVNALFLKEIEKPSDLDGLEKMILRYKRPRVQSEEPVLKPDSDNPVDFMFLNPVSMKIIRGKFLDVSLNGGGLKPDNQKDSLNLKPNTLLKNCSLKLKDSIFDLDAKIVKNDGILELTFLPVPIQRKKEMEDCFFNEHFEGN